MKNDVLKKFLPGLLTRKELPDWFITMADTRSPGKMEYVIWDSENTNIIHADYFMKGEFLETKTFELKHKKIK